MRTLFPVAVVLLVLLALPGAAVFAADLLGYEADVNRWLEARLGVSHHVAVSLPAAVVLFCVPPLIVLLYFLRLRRKPIPVPSTFLWKKSVEDLHVNRLLQWLRRNILLLLQLLAVLALIYAALGPRLHSQTFEGNRYILLVDNSASMGATDLAPNRLAWAKAEAVKLIDAAADTDTGMVIAFNSVAEIRQSYTANRAALRKAVEDIQPTQRPTRIDEALSLAASLANPVRSTEDAAAAPPDQEPGKERVYVPTEGVPADVHLFSDGRFPPVPDFARANLRLNYHTPPVPAENGSSDNVGIVRLDAERGWARIGKGGDAEPDDAAADDPTKLTVLATVRNYRNDARRVTVRVEVFAAGDRLVRSYAEAADLGPITKPDERERLVVFRLPDVPENADLTFRARLDGNTDAYPLDDAAWVVLGVVRKAKVLVVSPDGNYMLRDVLDLPALKEIAEVTYLTPDALTAADPKAYRGPAQEGKYDLIVYDRCGPAKEADLPAANALFVGHPPPPWRVADKDAPATDKTAVVPVAGPSVQWWDDKHPVMRDLGLLYEVTTEDSFRFPELPAGAKRLMEGERGHVLLAAIPRGSYTDLVLTFPLLRDGNRPNTWWWLKPSYVLFMRNVVLALGNVRDAGAEESVPPGKEKVLRPGGVPSIRVKKPGGDTKPLDRGTRADFVFTDTEAVGVYEAAWADQSRRFAVNLFAQADHDESDLAPVAEVKIGEQTVAAGEPRKQPRDLWKWAVLAGLAVLLVEWWVYNKRVQV